MTKHKRIVAALLVAAAMLASCDISSPESAPTPVEPAATIAPAETPAANGTAYPAPADVQPTVAPGYPEPTP